MFVISVLVLTGALSMVASRPNLRRYEPYITFVVKAFTPPISFFARRSLPIDHTLGENSRESFRRIHGMFGERLVDVYGRGLTKKQLLLRGLL